MSSIIMHSFLSWFLWNLLICRMTSCMNITGNFSYCNIIDERTLVNLDYDCTLRSSNLAFKPKIEAYIMTHFRSVLDSYGYQCSKKQIIRYLNTSFFGGQSESVFEHPVALSPIECWAMVQSGRCDGNPMKCSDDICTYKELPEGEYAWMQDVKLVGPNCKYHKRRVFAETNTSKVFSGSIDKCFASDLSCVFPESVVVWNATDVRKFMYGYVHRGENYTLSGDFLYSITDRYLFQLTTKFEENGFEFHKCTEGLIIYMVNKYQNNWRREVDRLNGLLEYSYNWYRPKLADIAELAMAQQDFDFVALENEFKYKFSQEFVKDCSIFLNDLRLLALTNEQFHLVRDLNGGKAIMYAKFGQLYLPRCQVVNSFRILNDSKECFKYIPVEVSFNDSQRVVSLFLTAQNYLVDYSPTIECEKINTKQLLNRTHFLVRNKQTTKLIAMPDLKFVDMTTQNTDFDGINFVHNQEIIDGYDTVKDFHGIADRDEDNDIDPHYHILPENNVADSRFGFIEFKNHASTAISEGWNWFTDKLKFVLYVVIGVLCFYLLLKLLLKYGASYLFGKKRTPSKAYYQANAGNEERVNLS